MTNQHVISHIGICIVAACVGGFVMRWLRQPPILGYICAGVLIGPLGLQLIADHQAIETVAEIGLILLLFMIGLEIDLHKMVNAGKWVIVPGILQFPVCALSAYALLGSVVASPYPRLYCAIAISLSSTMIVVKLLFDKMELDTLAGRMTLGILVFQDIWAIIVLALQPNLNHPEVWGLVRTFGSGLVLVASALVASRYVLPFVFQSVARVPELLLVLSLGWCFLLALVAATPWVGLSMEMGALIAGISIATFPYNLDVIAKAVSIRDFFITLFFVALGMQIPLPTLAVLTAAAAIAAVALLVRFVGVFGIIYSLGGGHRAALVTTINLAQVSEFSLVILALGVDLGHIDANTVTCVTWVFATMAVLSTYAITSSHALQTRGSKILSRLGLRDVGEQAENRPPHSQHRVVMLGFFRIADAFFAEVQKRHPNLLKELKVIDFNPRVKQELDARGVACVYGDISHADTLHHADIRAADMVLCTIPDAFLKGTSNKKLLTLVRSVCPNARVVLSAETPSQAKDLYAAGADYVLQTATVAGHFLCDIVAAPSDATLAELRAEAETHLGSRQELL